MTRFVHGGQRAGAGQATARRSARTGSAAARARGARARAEWPGARFARSSVESAERQADVAAASVLIADQLERSADVAADRALHGEAVGPVGTTRPSARAIASSPGAPLPDDVRARLERAFHADLSAVRVHTDSSASAAARSEGAVAFTAGRDIYFATDHFAPRSERGAHLLAHEIAHVLQQTGRPGPDGKIHATPLAGTSAPLQFKKGIPKPSTVGFTRPAKLDVDLKRFIDDYEREFPGDANLAAMIDYVIDLIVTKDGGVLMPNQTSNSGDQLARDIDDGMDPETAGARSFLIEVLEYERGGNKYFEAAAKILDLDTKLEIRSKVEPGVDVTKQQDFTLFVSGHRTPDWIAAAFKHPRLREFWDGIVATYIQLMFNPWSTPALLWGTDETKLPDIDPKTIGTATPKELKKTRSWESQGRVLDDLERSGFPYSDRVKLARILIDVNDHERRGHQDALYNKSLAVGVGPENLPMDRRMFIAGEVEKAFEPIAASGSAEYARSVATRIVAAAKAAQAMWIAAHEGGGEIAKRFAHGAHTDRDLLEMRKKILKRLKGKVPDTPELTALRDVFKTQAGKVFARKKNDSLPSTKEYKGLLADFKASLIGASDGLGGLFYDTIRKSIDKELAAHPDAPKIAEGIALAMLFIQIVLAVLDGYDSKTADKQPKLADVRLGHRVRMARILAQIGRFAGWTDLVDLAAPILTAEKGDSYVAIISDFEQKKSEKFDQLAVDFKPDRPFLHGTVPEASSDRPVDLPLTPRHIVSFFHLTIFQSLNDELQALQDRYGASKVTKKTQLGLKEVMERVNAIPRPEKWIAGEFEFVYKQLTPPTETTAATYDQPWTSDLVHANAKFKEFAAKRKVPGGDIAIPTDNNLEVFAWVIPDFRGLIAKLQKIDSLKDLIANSEDPPIQVPTDPIEWIIALADAADPSTIETTIRERLEGDDPKQPGLTYEKKRFLKLVRQTTTLRRRAFTAQLADDLNVFSKDRRSLGGHSDTPINVYRKIFDFYNSVEPWTDYDAQGGLLLLDLADALNNAFYDHADKMPGVLSYHLEHALQFAKGDELAKQALAAGEKGESTKDKLLRPREIFKDNAADFLGPGDTVDAALGRAATLEMLLKELVSNRRAYQRRFGFYSDGKSLYSLDGDRFARGDVFQIDGIEYEIVKIHRAFQYHPGFKTEPRLGSVLLDEHDGKEIDDRNGRKLVTIAATSERGNPAEAFRQKIAPTKPEPTNEEAGTEEAKQKALQDELEADPDRVALTDLNEDGLDSLSHAIEMEAIIRGLETTAAVIEFTSQAIITTAEIVLPGGQVLVLAELGPSVAQILDSDETQELIAKFIEDPKALVSHLWDSVTKMFTAEGLWTFLFNLGDNNPFDGLRLPKLKDRKTRSARQPRGRLGRIIRFLINIGTRFFTALMELKHRFRGPIASLRSSIMTHPTIAWILQKGVQLLSKVTDIVSDAGELASEIATIGSTVKGFVGGFVQHLTEMELPDALVPLEEIVALVIDFIIARIPKVKLIRPLLSALGITDKIATFVTDHGLEDSLVDPNRFYRSQILPLVVDKFHDVRDTLVDDLYWLINRVGGAIGFHLDPPTKDERGTGEPEGKPLNDYLLSPSPTREPTFAPIAAPGGGGSRLAPTLRGDAESRFGQDFGHVRLHTDAEADRMTSSMGADGMTTGSHVFLHSDLSPNAGRGADVFRHELTHVVQQSGARPLGGNHSDSPSMGSPDDGVSFDSSLESEARSVSDTMRGGRASSVDVGATPNFLGFQPSFKDDVLPRIVGQLTSFQDESVFKKKVPVEEVVPSADKAHTLWKQVKAFLSKPKSKHFANYLRGKGPSRKELMDVVGDHVVRKVDESKKDIDAIAYLAQQKVRVKKGEDPKTELNEGRFVQLLEGFIFAKSGIAIQIDYDRIKKGIDKIFVGYVFLPLIGGVSELWKAALENPKLGKGQEEREAHQREIRARLEIIGPSPWIWRMTGDKFQFSDKFVDDYFLALKEREAAAAKGGGKAPTSVPPVSEYADPNHATSNQGLHVATHGDLKKRGPGKTGRESHHLPQFLLVELFRNRNPLKAFPEPTKAYETELGIVRGSRYINTVAGIDLNALDPTQAAGPRANGLPAVLLAAVTHQKGKLHIDDFEDDAEDHSGQGPKLRSKFHEALPDKARTAFQSEDPKKVAKWTEDAKGGAKGIVLSAMKQTYSTLYKQMKDGMELDSTFTLEREYYEGIAAAMGKVDTNQKVTKDYQLTRTRWNAVIKAVETKNKAVMTGW